MLSIIERLADIPNVIAVKGIKSAMEHLNIMSKQERMPYQELDEEKHKHIGEIVEQIKKFV